MRIRKNAKPSSMIFPEGSRPKTVYMCKLNQSPWDVITPSDTQEANPWSSLLDNQILAQDSLHGNGSLGDSIGAVESVTSILDNEEKAITNVVEEGIIIVDDNDDNDGPRIGKQFGSKSKCEVEDQEEKESGLLKSCNNNHSGDNVIPSSLTSSKKSNKNNNQLTAGSRRGRARAAKKGSSSNPHEFYYYSGFGPSWRKRRRGGGSSGISRNIIDEQATKEVENGSAITTQTNTTPSSSSQIHVNEEFDYVEDDFDDDDDDDDENGENGDSIGRKRMRKPVKARSLKSLM